MPANPKSSFELMPCHGTALRKAARRVTQMYEDALAPTGLRSTQLAILLELTHRAEKLSSETPPYRRRASSNPPE